MIRTWVILVSGFTQGLHRENGTERLWRHMRRYSDAETCIQYKVWDDDAEEFAQYVKRNSEVIRTDARTGMPDGVYQTERPRILVAAYSWGAGRFFRKFAQECEAIGLTVDRAVLCDPVYRSRLLSMRWLAMTRLPRITVPASVRRVTWFRQFENRPRAQRLVAAVPGVTRIDKPVVLAKRHQEMDDARAYHEMVIRAFETLTDPSDRTDQTDQKQRSE